MPQTRRGLMEKTRSTVAQSVGVRHFEGRSSGDPSLCESFPSANPKAIAPYQRPRSLHPHLFRRQGLPSLSNSARRGRWPALVKVNPLRPDASPGHGKTAKTTGRRPYLPHGAAHLSRARPQQDGRGQELSTPDASLDSFNPSHLPSPPIKRRAACRGSPDHRPDRSDHKHLKMFQPPHLQPHLTSIPFSRATATSSFELSLASHNARSRPRRSGAPRDSGKTHQAVHPPPTTRQASTSSLNAIPKPRIKTKYQARSKPRKPPRSHLQSSKLSILQTPSFPTKSPLLTTRLQVVGNIETTSSASDDLTFADIAFPATAEYCR